MEYFIEFFKAFSDELLESPASSRCPSTSESEEIPVSADFVDTDLIAEVDLKSFSLSEIEFVVSFES